MFFGLKYDDTLCHHSDSARRISMPNSKDNILFIESCQLSRVSIYGTRMTVTYFDHTTEYSLSVIGIIYSFELVTYVFLVLRR